MIMRWLMATTASLLNAEDVSAHAPGVNAAAIPGTGAIWNPGEGWVDLPSLVQFLIKDFQGRGGGSSLTQGGAPFESMPAP